MKRSIGSTPFGEVPKLGGGLVTNAMLEEMFKSLLPAQSDSPIHCSPTESMEFGEGKPSQLVLWCSGKTNKISGIDLDTMKKYANFQGVQLKDNNRIQPHLKEIATTNLVVSLNFSENAANLEIFDVSKRGRMRKVYSFEEVEGVTGNGDVTFNSRRKILGAISVDEKISYHLFKIDAYFSMVGDAAKLCRKSKWSPHCSTSKKNYTSSLDIDPNGDVLATIDSYGMCLISNVTTNNCDFHLDMKKFDTVGRCRWSTNKGEPLLYIKYAWTELTILDVEKKALILENPIHIDNHDFSHWIDVCESDGNLLASGGADRTIKIYDRRVSQIVKTFDKVHDSRIHCVRWNPSGEMLVSAASDGKAQLLDLKTEKVIYTGANSDRSTHSRQQLGRGGYSFVMETSQFFILRLPVDFYIYLLK